MRRNWITASTLVDCRISRPSVLRLEDQVQETSALKALPVPVRLRSERYRATCGHLRCSFQVDEFSLLVRLWVGVRLWVDWAGFRLVVRLWLVARLCSLRGGYAVSAGLWAYSVPLPMQSRPVAADTHMVTAPYVPCLCPDWGSDGGCRVRGRMGLGVPANGWRVAYD